MRGIFLAALVLAATVFAPSAPASAAEQFVKMPQLVVRFETRSAYLRLLVVKVELAVASPQDAASVRADRRRIEQALQQALASVSYDDYASGNLASRVKTIGRTALRRAKLDYVGDVLVQEAKLM
jgi:hypothetical protein